MPASGRSFESALLRLGGWLSARLGGPQPAVAVEIAPGYVAAARAESRGTGIESMAWETLREGALTPSPVEGNIGDASTVQQALARVADKIDARGVHVALLLPDAVVRVFLLEFETFPRRTEEAIPLLRWRLRKSVPFDVEETVVSYSLQPARATDESAGGIEVLTALARQRIIRQYEEAAEAAGLVPRVVLGSTLATLPLLAADPDERSDSGTAGRLLARMVGKTLTTVIVRGQSVCVYRCTEMSSDSDALGAQELLDEIAPSAAYFQDAWRGTIEQTRLAGFSGSLEALRPALEQELGCPARPLLVTSAAKGFSGGSEAAPSGEALAGWMRNRKG